MRSAAENASNLWSRGSAGGDEDEEEATELLTSERDTDQDANDTTAVVTTCCRSAGACCRHVVRGALRWRYGWLLSLLLCVGLISFSNRNRGKTREAVRQGE